MSLQLSAEVAERNFALALDLAPAERVAVLGPNGSGKSTVAGIIAGTVRPDRGRATLDDRRLFDLHDTPRRRHWLPPHARNVALLAQDPLLFPHLTVLENVAFGPRSAGRGRAVAAAAARHWLEEVDAVELADRRPAQISGGQAQRVAIARALAAEPRLLVLDEPMAALDVAAAPLLRRMLRRVLADRSAVIITHDLVDALLLSHRVVVLEGGRVVEQGPTEQVLRHPRTPFTARIAGLNLIRGTADGSGLVSADHLQLSGVLRSPLATGEPAVAAFGPAAVSIFVEAPHGSPRNTLAVTLTELEPREGLVRVRATDAGGRTLVADVTAASVGELDLYPGRRVSFAVKAASVAIYPG